MKVYFLISASLIILSCNEKRTTKNDYSSQNNPVKQNVRAKAEQTNNPQSNIKDFQGIWRSYSYYLEHEFEFKDFNKDGYYRIINNKNVLDIILPDQEINKLQVVEGYLGFVDSTAIKKSQSEHTFVSKLKNNGSVLAYYRKTSRDFDPKNIQISEKFYRDFEVTEVFSDGFNYNNEEEAIDFRMIFSLPYQIFQKIKEMERIHGKGYIKKYNIDKLSSKVKVTATKTFFYNEMSENTQRKAFLVKGDIAYLENVEENWVKIYYDGKFVSGGYIKRSDIKILPPE